MNKCKKCENEAWKDYKLCLVCHMSGLHNFKTWYEKHNKIIKKKRNDEAKQKYYKYKLLKLCVYCGSNQLYKNTTTCKKCRDKKLLYAKNKKNNKRYKRELLGLCLICGNERYKNFRCCEKCYKRMIKNQYRRDI